MLWPRETERGLVKVRDLTQDKLKQNKSAARHHRLAILKLTRCEPLGVVVVVVVVGIVVSITSVLCQITSSLIPDKGFQCLCSTGQKGFENDEDTEELHSI